MGGRRLAVDAELERELALAKLGELRGDAVVGGRGDAGVAGVQGPLAVACRQDAPARAWRARVVVVDGGAAARVVGVTAGLRALLAASKRVSERPLAPMWPASKP